MAKYVIYGRSGCQWCEKAINFLVSRGVSIEYFDIRASAKNMAEFRKYFPYASTVPQVMYSDLYEIDIIGGYSDLVTWWALRKNSETLEGSDI